ncbi:Ig-like domain-containing protein [Pontibacter akesuensis]|uniref:Uncharacterized protein n=1 Tax=Pontibacter akesuensis TaxID=388950 RepID=A0A1I7JH07_9BACT|nr:Ig-like domain-containing protein [Pontibacter akesuensis]GHA70053.1 hypothetical protein GCM10007389_24080 [Pontibacter akesuensis]SFU84453.1 hypothetical protein SAMN04487941_2861 [Pontibacter akesuensis]
MKRSINTCTPLLLLLLGLFSWGCDTFEEDVIPVSFHEFKLFPDEVYMFKNNDTVRLMLLPLVNDSLKAAVSVTYGQPRHGQVAPGIYVGEEYETFYIPATDFWGTDSLTYTVCSDAICKTEKIVIHVEESIDFSTCVEALGADSLETTSNTPKEIKIFANDSFCNFLPFAPVTIQPQHGTLRFYDYPGSYKNPTFIYTPNRNFVGEDAFTYSVDFKSGMQQMQVKIKVKAQ